MYKKLFLHKYSILVAFFTILQQLVVCSSTFFIIKLSTNVVLKAPIMHWFILFFLSLLLAYIPSAASNYFIELSIYETFHKYVELFETNYWGHVNLYVNCAVREKKQPYLTQEAWQVFNETFEFFSDWLAIICSVLLNISMLTIFINRSLLYAYILSTPIIVFFLIITSSKISHLSKKSQDTRTKMMYVLSSAWDNILISNNYNLGLWNKYFGGRYKKSRETQLKTTLVIELTTTLSMFTSLIPIIIFLLYLITKNNNNPVMLAALISTLPRQITIIQYISEIVSYCTKWQGMKTKIVGLLNSLQVTEENQVDELYIHWNDISFHVNDKQYTISSLNTIPECFNHFTPCRVTIRGKNGSGKSTILYALKSTLQDSAFMMPAHSLLVFNETNNITLSTGEKILLELDEIEKNITPKVLLLDEWDANLDSEHINIISSKIEQLAKKICIIEVRHRR